MPEPTTDPEFDVNPSESPTSRLKPQWLGVQSFGMTDRGLRREVNEDQFLIAALTKSLIIRQSSLPQSQTMHADGQGHLFLVADGIGGSPAGEEASALAVKSIEEFLLNTLKWFFQLKGLEAEKVVVEFQDALQRADARIFAEIAEHPELKGMGTTLTLAYCLGVNLFVVNAGDSRCYLFHHGELSQTTHDHTLGEDLIRLGMSPLIQSDRLVGRHWITNAIGGPDPGVRVEVHKLTLEPGDVLLLATDGLTNEVTDEEIAAILATEPDPRTTCERLVAKALSQGGRDNVTVIVAKFEAGANSV